MRFVVGGQEYDLSRALVEERMHGVAPEAFHKHVVEMFNTVYPPKQVFAQVTGRPRGEFTTQEAQRVLTRLGFTCRVADELEDGTRGWRLTSGDEEPPDAAPKAPPSRLDAIEAQLATAMAAIQGLALRVANLESR